MGSPSDPVSDRGWLRGELRYRPLLILLGVGLGLRIATLVLYFPAVIQFADSPRYARAGGLGTFGDPWTPAGYPIFLKAVRTLDDQLWFTIAVQHLIGLLAGCVLYLALRRLEAPRWLALIPAGAFLLSGDVLYLEHVLLTDQFALVLTTLALSATIFGLRPRLDPRWLAAAGALAAGAWVSRSPFLVVLIVVLGAAAIAPGAVRGRVRAVGASAAGAALVVAVYVLAFSLAGGDKYLGLSNMTGWTLYSRTAQFADCSRFDPPAEGRVLCEDTPPEERGGRQHYLWSLDSIAVREMDISPETDEIAYEFATRAIRAQPGDYADAVVTDLARYVRDPLPSPRFLSGRGRDFYSFAKRDRALENLVLSGPSGGGGLRRMYDGTQVRELGAGALGTYQDLIRIHGVLIVVLLLLTVAGAIFGRGMRLGILLFGSASVLLYVFPTAVAGYELRFGVPPSILLACAGVLGAYSLYPLTRAWRPSAPRWRRGSPPESSPGRS